jgi:hypothetical protein
LIAFSMMFLVGYMAAPPTILVPAIFIEFAIIAAWAGTNAEEATRLRVAATRTDLRNLLFMIVSLSRMTA